MGPSYTPKAGTVLGMTAVPMEINRRPALCQPRVSGQTSHCCWHPPVPYPSKRKEAEEEKEGVLP